MRLISQNDCIINWFTRSRTYTSWSHGRRLTEPMHVQKVCFWLYGSVGPPRRVQLCTWQLKTGTCVKF